jgi:hypothetical protein
MKIRQVGRLYRDDAGNIAASFKAYRVSSLRCSAPSATCAMTSVYTELRLCGQGYH